MPPSPTPAQSPGTSRSTSATIPPNILRCLTPVTDGYGVDLRPELTRVGLDEEMMRSAALRVSYRQGSAVIRRALELTGDAHLGLRVGAAQHLTSWGLLGFAQMAADTLRDAIETGVRFQNLSGAMVVWSAEAEEPGYVLRAELPDPALDPPVAVFLAEEAFASVVALTRLSSGAEFAPRSVEFAFPAPPDTGPFTELFRCPLRFGAADAGPRPGHLHRRRGAAGRAGGGPARSAGAAGSAGDLDRAEPARGAVLRRAGPAARLQ